MKVIFNFKKYIKFSLISNYIIFNTLAYSGKVGKNNKEIKKNKRCSNYKGKEDNNSDNTKNEQGGSSQEELDKNKKKKEDKNKQKQPSQEKEDKNKQKKLQKQKELEENKKKERLKNLKIKYNNKLNQIDSEIKILKSSIKEYFEKNNFEKTVTVEEIDNITDPDNEKVGEKLEKLEKEGLKNLKINILNFLKTKFLNLKPKDKENKLIIKEEDFTNLEKSEKIDNKNLISIYNKLISFELILNNNTKGFIDGIKGLYKKLSDKKDIVLEIINDETLEEDDDDVKEQFDLEKENIDNIDDEKDIDKLAKIKVKLDNLELNFKLKFGRKRINVEKKYNSLKIKYDDLVKNCKLNEGGDLTFSELNFDEYLDKYKEFNETINTFKSEFIEKIKECTTKCEKDIVNINKEVEGLNKKIEAKNSEITEENDKIKQINEKLSSLEKEINEFNEEIEDIKNKNEIKNDDVFEILEFELKEIEKFEEISFVDSLGKDGSIIEHKKDIEDDDKDSDDGYKDDDNDKDEEDDEYSDDDEEKDDDEDELTKMIKKLKNFVYNIETIKKDIKEGKEEILNIGSKFTSKDDEISSKNTEINNLKNTIKNKKESIIEYFKNTIFDIFTDISEEDKDNFNNLSEKLKLDVFLKIQDNFKKNTEKQEKLSYEKLGNDVLKTVTEEYCNKLKNKEILCSTDFTIPISEEKYLKYKDKMIKKNELGEGSFGKIYKIDEDYVLKVINKKNEQFNEEDVKNEILFSYIFKNQDNIVKTYDFFEYKENIFIKLKFYKNRDLFEIFDKTIKLSQENKEKIYYQMITALSKFHEKNIAHRDLKVENIFIDEDYNAYIGDLGAAKKYVKNNNYILNLNTFSLPDEYVKQYYKGTEAYQMDLLKNDIYALGLVILSIEILELNPGIKDEEGEFIKEKQSFIKKKKSVKNNDLKNLLNIMLSEKLNIGNDMKIVLVSKYYQYLKNKFGSK